MDLEISWSRCTEGRTYILKSKISQHHLSLCPGEVAVFDKGIGGDNIGVWYQFATDMNGNRAIPIPHRISGVDVKYPLVVLEDQIGGMVGLGVDS